jgi:hypothetical protein
MDLRALLVIFHLAQVLIRRRFSGKARRQNAAQYALRRTWL